jgi:hypothetical protein
VTNATYIYDPFPTPSSNEVLYHLARKETYSLHDGFLVYHLDQIVEKEKGKMAFTTKWGSYGYNFMPFDLKNTPTLFYRIVLKTFCEYIHKFLESECR